MMRSSSGSVSYRVGGSSLSSSNLSALAPPFKVDKSLPKPNPTKPTMNYPEVPVYGTVFDPAGSFWNLSSSSSTGPKLVGTETMVADTTGPSSPNIYAYPGSQSSNALTPNYYFGSPNSGTAYDPFSYDQFPNNVSTHVDEGAKPYYPSYVSPPAQKDGYLGPGVGVAAGPAYDLLSNSGTGKLSGCGSSHIDHTQGALGCQDFEPKWGDIWIGVNDGDHGKWREYALSFSSKDMNVSGLSSDKSCLSVPVSNKSHPFLNGNSKLFAGDGSSENISSDGSGNCHVKKGACGNLGLDSYGNVSPNSGNCFDVIGEAYKFGSLGINQKDYKSSLDLNLGGMSTDCPNMQTFASVCATNESPHLREPVFESVTNFCGSQKTNGSSLEDNIIQKASLGSGGALVASTCPITLSNLPYSWSSFSAQNTLSATKTNPAGGDVAGISLTSSGYGSSCLKEPLIPPGLECRSNITIRRPVSSVTGASSSRTGKTISRPADKDASDIFVPQVPQQFGFSGFGKETNDVEAIYSTEKHSAGSDVHNPAEDSPCWKGASSSRFSPFAVSESMTPDDLVKQFDECNRPNSQETQKQSVSLGRSYEDSNALSQKPHFFDLNAGAELQFVGDCHAYTEGLNMLNKAKAGSGSSSLATQQTLKEGEVSSASILSDAAAAEHNGNYAPSAADSFHGVPSCSPRGEESTLKFRKSPNMSDSRMDLGLLLKAMAKLSDMFRSYCFANPAAVMEQHSQAIKHIISNLNASILMIAGTTPQNKRISAEGPSFPKESPVNEMVNNNNAEIAAAVKLSRSDHFLDSFPFKDDCNSFGNDNMTEAMKKILHENLQEEEEMDRQALLYKNLWLEAEAALCAVTAKARLHRMRIEMEKMHANVAINDTEKPVISSDVHSIVELVSKAKDSPPTIVYNHDSQGPSCSQSDIPEVPIMNKFDVPNSQVSLNSMKFEGTTSTRKEICFSSLHPTSPGTSGTDSDGIDTISQANEADTSVRVRYNILKDMIDKSDPNLGERSLGEENCLLEKDYTSMQPVGNDSLGSGPISHANDSEDPVFARYQILKCRVDSSDSSDCKGKQPGEDNRLSENVSSNPSDSFPTYQLFDSVGTTDDGEASVMARFRILQSRISGSNPVDKGPIQRQASGPAANEIHKGSSWPYPIGQSIFGPYPDFIKDADVKEFGVCVDEEATTQTCKADDLNSGILEGWYDNDHSSSSEWEHVSKDDLRKQN